MELDKNISELLYKYDCVIVPGLGGFVSNYSPAKLDKESNIFSPPYKSLSFNSYLKDNDGLLSKYISNKSNQSFEEVNAEIKKQVESYFADLNNGERVVFDKVGILYMDKAHRIQFSPDETVNYLMESFALRRVFALPIEKKQLEKKEPTSDIIELIPASKPKVELVKKDTETTKEYVIEQEKPVLETTEEVDKDLNNRKWRAAAILLPLIGLLAFFMSQNATSDKYQNLSNLNPFKDSVIQTYTERINDPSPADIEDINIDLLDTTGISADAETIAISLSDDSTSSIPVRIREKVITIAPKNTRTKVISTYVAPIEISELAYHVIGGCFSVKRNAIKKVKKLRDIGYDAYIIDKRRGLWRVSYGSYAIKNDALILLQKVKQNDDIKAWMLKK